MNKIFCHSSSPSPCLWHLHQAAGENEQVNDMQTWEMGAWKKAHPCVACSLKADTKIRKENSWTLFFHDSQVKKTHDSPSSTSIAGWGLSWACQGIECTQQLFHFGTGHVFPTANAKAMDDCRFLEGTGNCKLPFDILSLQWLHVWTRKMFKGHREIKTTSQLYCLRNVGIERTWLN